MNLLTNELKSLKEAVSFLSSRVDELEAENKKLKTQQIQQPRALPMNFEGMCTDFVGELQQRERRRLNLIGVGVPEIMTGSLSERQSADRVQCQELVETLGMPSSCIREISRIGKMSEGRCRLLKVVVDCEENKRLILSRAKWLRKSDDFRNVFLKPDLTVLQRKIDFELRKELKTKRLTEPDRDFVIHMGEVVERNSTQGFLKHF